MSVPVKGFECRPTMDGAANAKAGGRHPKASKEGNRGKWQAEVPRYRDLGVALHFRKNLPCNKQNQLLILREPA